MKPNKIVLGLVALIVVTLIIVISEQLSNRSPSESAAKFFPLATESNINSLLIKNATDAVKIQRKGDIWVIPASSENKVQTPLPAPGQPQVVPAAAAGVSSNQEYLVDSAQAVSAVEKIVSAKKKVLVSENPSKQQMFEVDSAKGLYLEAFDHEGKSLGAMIIGKRGLDYMSSFARTVGSNDVYSVEGGMNYGFWTDKNQWRDKTVMKFDRNSAKKITLIKADGVPIVLQKPNDTGSTWSLTAPIASATKTDQVNELLNKLSFFTATGFEDVNTSDSVTGLNNPELTVAVTLNGGATRKAYIGHSNGTTKQFWVKADGKESIFKVADVDIQVLDKNVDKLRAEAATDSTHKAAASPVKPPVTKLKKKK